MEDIAKAHLGFSSLVVFEFLFSLTVFDLTQHFSPELIFLLQPRQRRKWQLLQLCHPKWKDNFAAT